MNSDENHDHLVDMLLWELVGEEVPPDVRTRVLKAAGELAPAVKTVQRRPFPQLASARAFRRSKASAFAMAAVLTLLAVAGVLVHFHGISLARTPVLTSVSGTVDRSLGPIALGESLSTGSLSSAVLSYQDGSVVELTPDTTILVAKRQPWDRSKGLILSSGEIQAEVSPQPNGRPMVISSSDAHAKVVGTRLSYHLNNDRTRLEVAEGSVHFVPRKVGRQVLVEKGYFAESGKTGFRHEKIPVPGITRFTLMNAESDRPIRDAALVDGEVVSLASLPTRKINIRADFEGPPPAFVTIDVTRRDRGPTGLPPRKSNAHEHPPYFVAGDHWAEGRPEDCGAWTPHPGHYWLSAEAVYTDERRESPGKPLRINIHITK